MILIMKNKILIIIATVFFIVGMIILSIYLNNRNKVEISNEEESGMEIMNVTSANFEEEVLKTPWVGFCSEIEKVVIGDGVTTISGSAFERCSYLSAVSIPNSVTTIGKYAFSHNNNLFIERKWWSLWLKWNVTEAYIYFYMKKTKQGYEISVVGDSINTAKYVGMNTKKIIIRTSSSDSRR